MISRAPEDVVLGEALHRELAKRTIQTWPSGPAITAEYASAELVTRLIACNGLVTLATPAAVAWPFALTGMRLARELSRGVLVVAIGLGDDVLQPWLRQLAVAPDALRPCVDEHEAALAVEHWTPPAADVSPQVVQFAAARAELLRVASHGGRLAELGAIGVEPGVLRATALHLRAIGLIDFSGSLDDERTSFITVG